MEINFTSVRFLLRNRLLRIIMRTFIFLFCTTLFAIAPYNVVSQNSKIKIEQDKTLAVDEVFDLIMDQTDYKFFYEEGIFKGFPKVHVKKGSIKTNRLLSLSLAQGNLEITVTDNNAIVIKDTSLETAATKPQGIKISGIVTDENAQPLSGANIIEKGTTNGAQADFDGNFKINVTGNKSILVISYVGYVTQEIAVGNKTKLNVVLAEDAAALDEIVVVGYGTQRVKDVTGSIVQVTAKDFAKGANTNAFQLLQGKASGVQISQSSSAPGGTVEIKVRGLNSVNGGNGVLVVVDGLPNGNVDALSPDDIESIQILKDASASAIYGSRAANGVVLITTKQGAKGGLKVSYNTYIGIQDASKRVDMLNGQEYMETLNALNFESNPANATDPSYDPIYSDSEIAAIGAGFNWQDQILRGGFINNHQLSLSGGSDKATYYASLNYYDAKGVLRNTGEKRYNTRINVTVTPTDKLKINFNLNANRTLTDLMPLGNSGIFGTVAAALQFDPTLDAQLDAQGRYKLNPFIQVENPEAIMQGFNQNRARNEIIGNAKIEYEVFDGFKMNVNLGARLSDTKFDSYENRWTQAGLGAKGKGLVRNNDNSYGIAEYLLSYERETGNHNFKIQGGLTYEKFVNRELEATAEGFLADVNGSDFFGAASAERYSASTERFEPTLRSYLGRATYAYKDKYLFTASFRADGTSKFSKDNNTAVFPSASAGWQIGSEPFMEQQNLFDNLKLRVGYGEIGNQAINNFETISTFVPGDASNSANAVLGGQILTGAVPARIPNPNLVWETTKEINLGLDFSMLDYALSGSIEYYVRNTSDQLFNRPVPTSTGFSSFRQNFGNVRNKGFDITLSSKNIANDNFSWETDLTFSTLKNEVTEVPDFVGGEVTGGGGFSFAGDFWVVKEGEPMAAFYGYQIDGIYSTPAQVDAANALITDGSARAGLGHPIVNDVNGDNKIDPSDRIVLGKPFADYTFGFNNRLKYKNLTLDVYVLGVQGIETFNNLIAESFYPIDPDRNKLAKYYLNRWTPDNTTAQYPSMVEPGRYQDGRKVNKWTVQDASFIRIKNITLGYDLPIKVLGLQSANFYVSLENFFTFSDFDGFDPDANSSGQQGSSSRSQRGTFGDYPLAKTVRIGARFTL